MPDILLLGAGFSRNWGGWLANEALEYLLGCKSLTPDLLEKLWLSKDSGGFEKVLSDIQDEFRRSGSSSSTDKLRRMEEAITEMFGEMNQGFIDTRWNFSNNTLNTTDHFLAQFDAIFTLNQDVLLEMHYTREINLVGGKYRQHAIAPQQLSCSLRPRYSPQILRRITRPASARRGCPGQARA